MTARSATNRRAWGSLSRDEILRVARQVIDEDGLQDLSLNRLGKRLRAGSTSIYWYFQSKEELVAAVMEDVTREMYLLIPPVGDGPWDEEFVANHLAGRRLLQQARLYREVFAYQAQTPLLQEDLAPFILDGLEALLGLLIRDGLTPDEAVQTYNAFQNYTRAFVLIEEGVQRGQMDPSAVQLLALAIGMAPDQVSQGLLNDDCYRRGLDVLVAGVRQRYLVTPKRKAAGARTRQARKQDHGL